MAKLKTEMFCVQYKFQARSIQGLFDEAETEIKTEIKVKIEEKVKMKISDILKSETFSC